MTSQRVNLVTSITRLVAAVPQTLEELLSENEPYLNWLDSIGAEETKNDFVLSLEQAAAPSPEVYYYTPTGEVYQYAPLSYPTLLVEVGGVSLSPYTHRLKSTGSAADPLNLIFTGEARVDRVAEILQHELFPPELWRNTKVLVVDCADPQWVYVDSGLHYRWHRMRYSLAVGGCSLNRCHVRLFDGGYDKQLGDFTLANVHYERSYANRIHVIEDWDKSQDFARRLFESKPFCKKIGEIRLQAQGEELQCVAHDGLASIIELQ
jgi:hypothetical protein